MEYPKVKQKLPELFEVIITCDKEKEYLKKLPVIPFDDFKRNKQRRRDLTRAAEEFIIKSKGKSGGFK